MFELTIDHLLWRLQHAHPAAEVIGVAPDGTPDRRTAAETAVRARALAAGLGAVHQLAPGDTVAVLAFNTRSHLELMYAVPVAGARLECPNVRLGAETLLRQLAESRPRLVVVDDEAVQHPVIGETVREVLAGLAAQATVLAVEAHGGAAYEALVDAGRELPFVHRAHEDDVAFLFHTSGTTGSPKSYPVRHRDVVLHALAQATTAASGLRTDDVVLPLAPFFHVNGWGLPFTCAMTGSSLVLPGGDLGVDRVLGILRDLEVTVAAAVPTLWHDVCRVLEEDPSGRPAHLREVLSGGSAVPQKVVDDVATHLGATVTTAWGMTETMACSTYERRDPATSAGVPIPLVELRVAGAFGDAAPGEQGQLQVRGPFVVGAPTPGAWTDTGDIASVDAHGRLQLHDRVKDLIKSGGEWILSSGVEQRICEVPGVAMAAVVATPDERWGERPVAYVVPDPAGPPLEVDALRAHLAATLPRWWVPEQITLAPDLPRTAVGKINKVALRRAHAEQSHPSPDPAP